MFLSQPSLPADVTTLFIGQRATGDAVSDDTPLASLPGFKRGFQFYLLVSGGELEV